MEMKFVEFIAVVALLVSVAGLLWQHFGVVLKLKGEISCIREDLGSRISKVETKVELFWGALGEVVKSMVQQPIHFRKDELMDKLDDPEKISTGELVELKGMLTCELRDLTERKDLKAIFYGLALYKVGLILVDRGV